MSVESLLLRTQLQFTIYSICYYPRQENIPLAWFNPCYSPREKNCTSPSYPWHESQPYPSSWSYGNRATLCFGKGNQKYSFKKTDKRINDTREFDLDFIFTTEISYTVQLTTCSNYIVETLSAVDLCYGQFYTAEKIIELLVVTQICIFA